MKQGKLIRRAVSAALAGCMMFSLSAPALAESTDALMQLSMTRRSAVSVLDAENSGTDANASVATKYGITIEITGRGKVEVDSDNCNNILDFLKYDPDEQKLTLLNPSADAVHYLTIDAPNTDVVLESTKMIVNFNLLIENARSVKVSSTGSWAPVYGKVFIYCACPVTLEHTEAGINHGVAISGIEFAAPVNASDFVYYTSDAPDATPTDAGTGTIPASTENYLRIVPKVFYTITTADDATITVGGKAVTSVYEGAEVTVTAADRENADFTGWTAEGITLTDDQKANPTVTFTMPDKNVTLTPNYKQYYTITSDDAAVIIKVNDAVAGKALKGQTIKALAPNKEGYVFENWAATGIDLGKQVSKNWITFEMPESNVTLNPQYAKLHAITVLKGTATLAKAKEGTEVTVTADDRPGYVFDRWVVNKGDVELTDAKSTTTTFTVKGEDVEVEAKYKELHGIAIEGGAFTVNGGTAETAKKGDAIVATADSAPAGQKFSHWEVTGVDGLTEEQLKNVPLEFTMPRGEVTLKAVFKTLHKIGVKFSTADKDTAIEGETVKITAESREGYVFDRWEVNYGNVAVVNKNAEETTFVMPDEPVTAVAKYKKLLGITVNSGKAYVEDAVTDAALKGKPVVVKADEIEGKRFDHWEIVSGKVILNDLNAPETMFTMPETAVEITAVYNDLHAITVNNGTANVKEAVIGDTVKIKAESREGYVFDRWEVSYGDVVVDDKNAEETTFTMPDSMVVLTARYKALQSITLENGKAYAGDDEITTAKKGTEVTIKADNLDGKVFDHWEIVSGNVTLKDANKAETSFTMPAESISLKAVYNTIHSIHTTFCTADPASAIVGTEITVTAETREGYEFDGWAVSDGVELYDEDGLTAKFIMPDNDVTIEAKYKQYHTITMVGGKGTAYDADGKEITSAVVGDKITIVANDRDSHEFNRWEIDPDNVILEDPNADETAFIMPDEPVSVEAKYKHLQSITMNHGTAYDEDFSETDIAKAKQTITIKAEDRYADGLVFDHWTVDTDNVTLADEYGEKTTFEMVNGAVELTAHYKARVTVFSVPAKFEEGIGEHSDETWEKVGETATITAEIDEETFPGMEFDYWEVIPTDLDIGNIHSQTISFEVPECEVKLVAHWKASGMNPDEDLDPGFGVEPESSDGGAGAAIAGVAIGGAAVWGGYEIATRIILNDLLPAGAAIPANRGQLALLIWTEKGKPEPAAQPAFADVADADMAKAAQWCMEQGIMEAKTAETFKPEGWTPKFKVIETWNKAFPKQ